MVASSPGAGLGSGSKVGSGSSSSSSNVSSSTAIQNVSLAINGAGVRSFSAHVGLHVALETLNVDVKASHVVSGAVVSGVVFGEVVSGTV